MSGDDFFSHLNWEEENGSIDKFFSHIESNPLIAVLLWYLNAGYGRFDSFQEFDQTCHNKEIDVPKICEEINQEVLTNTELSMMLDTFFQSHSYIEGDFISCGACGLRQQQRKTNPTVHFKWVNLEKELYLLKFTVEDDERLLGMKTTNSIQIPVGNNGETEEILPWKVLSLYKSRRGCCYHLHPELVEERSDGTEYTRLCPTCYQKIVKKGKTPELSIAGGIDFGNYKRIQHLQYPNLHEQLVLAQVRLFQVTIKISSNSRGQQNYTLNRLRGHAILFSHDAPQMVKSLMGDVEYLKNILKLHFVDEEGKFDRLAKEAFGTTTILARPYVIKQWLLVLQQVHPHYADMEDDYIEDITNAVNTSLHHVKTSRYESSDQEELRFEGAIGSDVAMAQSIDSRLVNSSQDNTNHAAEGGSQEAGLSLRYSYVTPSLESVLNNKTLRNGVLLRSVAKVIMTEEAIDHTANNGDGDGDSVVIPQANIPQQQGLSDDEFSSSTDNEEEAERNTFTAEVFVPKSYRLGTPVDDFDCTDRLLSTAFPHVFLFGSAYSRCSGNLSVTQRNHLLQQFTNIPAIDRRLLGYLFDVKKRFEVMRGMSAQVKGNRKAVDTIKELLEDANTDQLFQQALQNPDGKVAKAVLDKILPILTIGGRHISYGAVESNVSLTKILEGSKRYGPGCEFLTISFDDINNPRAIRATYSTVDNTKFPAVFEPNSIHGENGKAFMGKLRMASTEQVAGRITIPEHSPAARATLGIQNPVAYVQESKTMVNDVLSILLKLPPESFFGATEGTSTRKTRYFKSKTYGRKGIFGHTLAYYGVVEDHQKGTLHYHLIIYGGVPPYILQRFAAIPKICEAITQALDSMHRAKLPMKTHVRSLIHKILRESNNLGLKPRQLHILTPPPILNLENPMEDLRDANGNISHPQVWQHTNHQAAKQEFHEHMATCRKGMNGNTGCRLCKPSGISSGTRPLQLIPCPSTDQETQKKYPYQYDVVPVQMEQAVPTYQVYSPLHKSSDKQIIVWELDRPEIQSINSSDLPELGQQILQSLDAVNTDEIREAIIDNIAVCLDGDEAYPNDSPFWNWIKNVEYKKLIAFYAELVKRLLDANGYVVDHNPILSYCTGSHNNALLLGSSEQAKAAMFYVSPYVSKSKVKLTQCLTTLEKVRRDIQAHPSTAADSGTTKRTVQHFLTRTLNKLNTMMELSDYQIVADLLRLPSEITSDTFCYSNPKAHMAYQTHVQLQNNQENAFDQLLQRYNQYQDDMEADQNQPLDFLADKDCLDDQEEEPNDPNHDVDNDDDDDDDDDDSGNGEGEGDGDGEGDGEGDGDGDGDGDDDRNGDELGHVSPHLTVQQQSSQQSYSKHDLFENFGMVPIYTIEEKTDAIGSREVKQPIPYVAHYGHRGEGLRYLSRMEWEALVQIKKRRKTDTFSNRRTPAKQFLFTESYSLHTCHAQFLRAKQRVIVFSRKQPKCPGNKPDETSTKQYKQWKEKADYFSRYFLTMFRPELNCYDISHTNHYRYDWEALETWIEQLQRDSSILSKFRLQALHFRVHGLTSCFRSKVILSKFRGRNRTLWTDQQKSWFDDEERLHQLGQLYDGTDIDDYMYEKETEDLPTRMTNEMNKQLTDDHAQLKALNRSCSAFDRRHHLAHHSVSKITNLASLIFTDSRINVQERAVAVSENESLVKPAAAESSYPTSMRIANQRPSDDTANLNEKQREMHELFHQYLKDPLNDDNKPPSITLLTGMAGTGKSRVILAINKIAKQEKLKIMNTSFTALNASQIGGSTTASLISLNVEKHSKEHHPMQLQQLRHFQEDNDIDNVALIIIDEVSNQAPFHLARLHKVCQQARNNYDQPFAGIPVLLVGDFGQLPPVRAVSLPSSLMAICKHEEERKQQLQRFQLATGRNPFSYSTDNNSLPGVADKASTTRGTKRKAPNSWRNDDSMRQHRASETLSSTSIYNKGSPLQEGCAVFSQAKWFEVTEQMRSKDVEHDILLSKMYKGNTVTVTDLQIYKPLDKDDFEDDDNPWLFAPIIVSTNRERHSLNHPSCIRYAKAKSTVVIRWMAKYSQWAQKPKSPQFIAQAMEDPCFYEYFLAGANGFITDNISKKRDLLNGTPIRYHSLCLTDDQQKLLDAQLLQASPGDFITLTEPPLAVNVILINEEQPPDEEEEDGTISDITSGVRPSELSKAVEQRDRVLRKLEHAIHAKHAKGIEPEHISEFHGGDTIQSIPTYTAQLAQWNKKVERCGNYKAWEPFTLVPERIIIPLLEKRFKTSSVRHTVIRGGQNGLFKPSKARIVARFPVEPAFVITVHKAQGRTLDKVILALSHRHGNRCQMVYAALYVALSRVHHRNDIRLLLSGLTSVSQWSSLEYISALQPDKCNSAFFAGYSQNRRTWKTDCWNAPSAYKEYKNF
jgi:hypothetical protein